MLNKIAKLIFLKEDNCLLTKNEDGVPSIYLPIIPMALVNGFKGVAVDYNATLWPRNPLKLINNIICYLNGEEIKALKPYFKGLKGYITQSKNDKNTNVYYSLAYIKKYKRQEIILDIPKGLTINRFHERLETLKEENEMKNYEINSVDNNEIDTTVYLLKKLDEEMCKKLLLSTSINERNINCINDKGYLIQFKSAKDMLINFCEIRLNVIKKEKIIK